ncbi:hypothetical protein B0I33_11413 [Prauserella shujinwangii]|uniref:Uncharacterized protein n=1 Tax=Prauserella shujinwangii TaxID=1453103 RepID=A0A2T0LKT9_9PSEU|nr:hypothetical protein B0I33_11413 [Prauserella shujinwangii]
MTTRTSTDHRPANPLDGANGIDMTTQENTQMLIYEELARSRIRELHHGLDGRRYVRRARAARRWGRLATWASRRSGQLSR